MTPQQALQRISGIAHELVDHAYRLLSDELHPALEAQGIHLDRMRIRTWPRESVRTGITEALANPAASSSRRL